MQLFEMFGFGLFGLAFAAESVELGIEAVGGRLHAVMGDAAGVGQDIALVEGEKAAGPTVHEYAAWTLAVLSTLFVLSVHLLPAVIAGLLVTSWCT